MGVAMDMKMGMEGLASEPTMLYTPGMNNTKTSQEVARRRRAVRQQAQATKLMGVDFVPCFRTGEGIDQTLGDGPCELPEDDRRGKAQRAMKRLRSRYEQEAPHQYLIYEHCLG